MNGIGLFHNLLIHKTVGLQPENRQILMIIILAEPAIQDIDSEHHPQYRQDMPETAPRLQSRQNHTQEIHAVENIHKLLYQVIRQAYQQAPFINRQSRPEHGPH